MPEPTPQPAARPSWQPITQALATAGRHLARWAAEQSWGRLFLLAMLALIAQSILTSNVLHWDDQPGPGTPVASEDAGAAGDGIRIGSDGIQIGGPDGITLGRAPAPPATPAPPPPPAPGSVLPRDEGAGAGDHSQVVSVVVSHTPARSLGGVLKDVVEGCVLLLIVFLITAKIVLRRTAESDARAARAEASAAAAGANAEREALQRQLAEARLQALQAQVEPHFLFNTLASVDYLIETDPARASAMQKHLIQYLRAALPRMRDPNSQLGREADLVRAYLEILKVRMEERLAVAFDIPEGLRSAEFPPMMLQTLVENAIRHGVEPKPAGGQVSVRAAVVDGALEVTVADTGVGLATGTRPASAGGGLGLANLRERLARLYPGEAGFELVAGRPEGAVARIRLPYRVAAAPDAGLAGEPAPATGAA